MRGTGPRPRVFRLGHPAEMILTGHPTLPSQKVTFWRNHVVLLIEAFSPPFFFFFFFFFNTEDYLKVTFSVSLKFDTAGAEVSVRDERSSWQQ